MCTTRSRPGALVQVVDVLGDHEQVVAELALEAGERIVRGVRHGLRHGVPAQVVEALHRVGVAGERLGGRDVLDAVPLPQPAGVAEGGHAALGRDAGAGEHDESHASIEPRVRPPGYAR